MSGAEIESQQVKVYRSSRREETYAFIAADNEFENLPDEFKAHFGEAVEFYTFHLSPDREMPQADARKVLASIADQGFYLQLPPPKTPTSDGSG